MTRPDGSQTGRPGRDLASRDENASIMNMFKIPVDSDVRHVAPTLLWTLHMGILLYFLYDDSPRERRTRRLIDAAVKCVVLKILHEAGLVSPIDAAARAKA